MTRPRIKSTDEGVSSLYRRAKRLESKAKEYLALLQALDDIVENYDGDPDEAPLTEDEADDVRIRINDSLACLGAPRREREE